MNEELIYLNALNRISVLGPVRIRALQRLSRTARAAWEISAKELETVPELKGLAGRIAEERRRIDPEREWDRLQQLQINCLSVEDPAYPELLRQIPQPPVLLYCRGRLPDIDHLAVAIVGSRRCTLYGKEVAFRLAGELAALGVAVISGMALGVDSAAHRGALAARGCTVAVLGCGVEHCYPPANESLMKQIIGCGAVISEFPLDTKPLPQHFPQRNRIISGLSMGTVVVEATEKSGALITAHYALEQNREVFAVPGNVGSPYSRGSHRLLKEGARLVESAYDIIDELPVGPLLAGSSAATAEPGAKPLLSEAEKRLLEQVPYHPIHLDRLIRVGGLSPDTAGALLLSLELKGQLRQLPGKYFCRR
jgi:DNA processing protein